MRPILSTLGALVALAAVPLPAMAAFGCEKALYPEAASQEAGVPAYAAGSSMLRPVMALGPDVRLTFTSAPEYGLGAWTEILTTKSAVWAATVVPSAQGCTRLVVRVDPREIGIASVKTDVVTRDFPVRFVKNKVDLVRMPAKDPSVGTITVYLFKDGAPVNQADVSIWADMRAVPEAGRGRTVAHEHLYKGGSMPAPSLKIGKRTADGKPDKTTVVVRRQGNPVIVKTDNMGEARAVAIPGYRGGVESVIAQAKVGSETFTVAAPVILTVFPRLVHFAEYFKRGPDAMKPSNEFPFLMSGATRHHMYNHFIRGDIGSQIASIFHTIWLRDEANRKSSVGGGNGRWVQLNDMSLEYGGQFKLGVGMTDHQCNTPSNTGSHATHNLGIDFDFAPCYTVNGGGHIDAGTCYSQWSKGGSKEFPVMDKALLEEFVIGGGRGVIFQHKHNPPEEYFHLHVRFNPDGFGSGSTS